VPVEGTLRVNTLRGSPVVLRVRTGYTAVPSTLGVIRTPAGWAS
jgi:hypothetical protein